MNSRTWSAIFLAAAIASPSAQEPAPKPSAPAIRSDPTTIVVPAGKHDVKVLIDASASFLRRTILVSATELGDPEPIEVQSPLAFTAAQCETALSQMLWSRGLVLVGTEQPTGCYEVINAVGPRGREITARARFCSETEVLANPDRMMPVAVRIQLDDASAQVATNALRPFFGLPGGAGPSLTLGTDGQALLVSGLQQQVVQAVRLLRKVDGREGEPPAAEQTARVVELEKTVAKLRARVVELERKVAAGK